MQRQRDRTLPTLDRLAAGPANQCRHPTSVQEQQHLLVSQQRVRNRGVQLPAEHRTDAGRQLLAHVDHVNNRLRDRHRSDASRLHAFRQSQQSVLPGSGTRHRDHVGRRRAQHRRDAPGARHLSRHVGGPITRLRILLLVRPLVLLVHDHQRQVRDRAEQCRTRTDHDAPLARVDLAPLLPRFATRQTGMAHCDLSRESRPEPRDRLRRERDLGNQDDHPAAGIQRSLRDLEVDLGLPAAGRAVQQEGLAPVCAQRGCDRIRCIGLVGGQASRSHRIAPLTRLGDCLSPQVSPPLQRIDILLVRTAGTPRRHLVQLACLQQTQQAQLAALGRRPSERIGHRMRLDGIDREADGVSVPGCHARRAEPTVQHPAATDDPRGFVELQRRLDQPQQQIGLAGRFAHWPTSGYFPKPLDTYVKRQPLRELRSRRNDGPEAIRAAARPSRRPRRKEERYASGDRRHVSRRDPLGEIQLTMRNQRLRIEDVRNPARFSDVRIGGNPQHNPDGPSRPPGDDD